MTQTEKTMYHSWGYHSDSGKHGTRTSKVCSAAESSSAPRASALLFGPKYATRWRISCSVDPLPRIGRSLYREGALLEM